MKLVSKFIDNETKNVQLKSASMWAHKNVLNHKIKITKLKQF